MNVRGLLPPAGRVRHVTISGGTPFIRRALAFDLGRAHRARDSYGPRGRLAVFDDSRLTQAYLAGYFGPYWWEDEPTDWRTLHANPRIAFYRYLRTACGLSALGAWRLAGERLRSRYSRDH